jgi:hypothetical protein
MTKLELEIHDDVVTTINKIKNINDAGVEIYIPEGSVLFENVLNLKLIQSFSDKNDIAVHFKTEDPDGNNLIALLNGNGNATEFIEGLGEEPHEESERKIPSIPKLGMPKIGIPRINMGFLTSFFRGKPIVLLILLVPLIVGYVIAGKKLPRANARITVDSSHLTRSLTIRVVNGSETTVEDKILKGHTLAVVVEDSNEIETTGEKLVGDKAQGEITIYNNTDNEKEFEKGTVLQKDDEEYVLDDTVTVPARTQLPPDPANPSIISYQKGEADADIVAGDIGKKYNLDSGEELEFDDYDSSEFTAFTKTDVDGGSSETVSVVAEEDLEKVAENLGETLKEKATDELKDIVEKGQAFIDGSTTTAITEKTYSHEVGEETDKLKLTQKATAQGLVYKKADLDEIIDKLVEDLIPEGFELSDKERELKVEVLGNSTNSVLSQNQADIQVTLKTFVVPTIKESDLKEKIMGKPPQEAHKILGSIKNVKTYELTIAPNIPLFQNVPNDEERIHIEIERD